MGTRARLLACVAVLVIVVGDASAATWRVELDGSGDFADIQPAVDAAAAGDTIRIGPGRFNTFRPVGSPLFQDVIIWITKPDLVFIGAGQDVTRIGTESYFGGDYGESPTGIYSVAPNDFTLRYLTLEHTAHLVLTNAEVDIANCMIRAHDERNVCLNLQGTGIVQDCEFDLARATAGVIIIGAAHDIVISDCHFGGPSVSVAVYAGGAAAPNINISNCTVDDGIIGFSAGATGSIRDCSISSSRSHCLIISGPATTVQLSNVVLHAPESADSSGLLLRGAHVLGQEVTILESRGAAIWADDHCTLSLSNSNLLPSSGFAVRTWSYYSSPAVTLDLRNNNWGTTDAARIAELIWDHNDDPANPCTVLFEPFIGQPVGIEGTTWGELKASFR